MKSRVEKQPFFARLWVDLKKHKGAYLMVIPVLVYFVLFSYKPMYGVLMAFENYRPVKGIWGSQWVGFEHFETFFNSYYFKRILKNTLVISFSTLFFSFPIPIIFALMLNEIRNMRFKKIVQTVSYMPHFLSLVVVCSMVKLFTADDGFITQFLTLFGMEEVALLTKDYLFVPIYVISGVWQEVGWNTIIYLSALAGIDQQLYEAASIDGAGRWKKMVHVTLPGISGTIIILFILKMGSMMSVGHEKILLLYNDGILETADVISTFVYRKGLIDMNWSYASAVGLFNSIINLVLVLVFNKISKKTTEVGLF